MVSAPIDAGGRGLVGVTIGRGGTPGHGADACHELMHAERFDHIVVGAHLQRYNPVDLLAASADHDDRYLRACPDGAADVSAVHVGQPQIQQHEIRRGRRHIRHGRGTSRHPARLEAGPAQAVAQPGSHRFVVFDHEHPHVRIISLPRPGSRHLERVFHETSRDLGRFLDFAATILDRPESTVKS